ncbi:MAG: hypothetical protein DRN05_00475 [Thermoplasmata archaeon]|nr:MAG: hypothetical protein DRN05_00475 [Thermoplasmata archaeon]
MIETIEYILPYIKGLWTLPWILVGFIITIILSHFIDEKKVDGFMKKIGIILLYFFVPLLLFRIFLNQDFGKNELEFVAVTTAVLFFMYITAYVFAYIKANKMELEGSTRQHFIKTVFTNQGRSSAFIGGALLASPWKVEAAIFISLVGIALFAVIPYILSYMHKKEADRNAHLNTTLPWYLKLYPWYLILFVITAVVIHGTTGITINSLGETGIILDLYTSLTIPAALYYVGSSIHPHDFRIKEMRKIFSLKNSKQESKEHWTWVKNIFILTVIITPLLISIIFILLLILNIIPKSWFAVIIINSFLPITSTNMFLVPYGIDKKSTAHAVTWTTIVCVPIIVFLIYIFTIYLG